MNGSEHTPGPWVVDSTRPGGLCVRSQRPTDAEGILSHNVCVWDWRRVSEQDKANARLIAAAPEMLASLKEVFGMIERHELVRDITDDAKPDWALRMLDFVPRLQRIQAAIDKAEYCPMAKQGETVVRCERCGFLHGYLEACPKDLNSRRATLAHNAERSRGGDSDRLDDARGLEQSCKPHRWLKVAAGTDGQERCSECGSSRTPVKSVGKKEKK